jgi:hypothetical protein
MILILRIVLTLLCLCTLVEGQIPDEKPSEVRKVGGSFVAYYSKANLTQVLISGGDVFDNSTEDWPVAKGAQRISFLVTYTFSGRVLEAKPSSLDFVLGSVAGLPARFEKDTQRVFQLTGDGREILRGQARLTARIPTSWVTYEDVALKMPVTSVEQMLLTTSIRLKIGDRDLILAEQQTRAVSEFLRSLSLLADH